MTKFTIHKEGYKIIRNTVLLVALVALIVNLISSHQSILHYLIYAGLLVFLVFVIRFFRIPKRDMTVDANAVVAPADGTVVIIQEVEEKEYFKGKRIQVSIFMSPNNVHVNRYPLSGNLVYIKYWPGKYWVAWHPKSSLLNERNTIVIDNPEFGTVLVRQIAGAVARRIVSYAKENEQVTQNNELGFIKFGSRVDLFLPLSANIMVKLNEKVKGGISRIATTKKS